MCSGNAVCGSSTTPCSGKSATGSEKLIEIISAISSSSYSYADARVNNFAEHPWIIGLSLAGVAALLLLVGLRLGSIKWLLSSLAPLIGIALTIAIAWFSVTPAQHATIVINTLVAAAVAGNPAAAKACFARDATIHMGAPEQPGEDRARIDIAFDSFANRHRIDSNDITSLSATTTSAESATVGLSCRTQTASSYGIVPTRWSFEVALQKDGTWRIVRIIWRTVGNQKPSLTLL